MTEVFNFSASLVRIRDARSKRGRTSISKKFFDTLRKENMWIPEFNVNMNDIMVNFKNVSFLAKSS